ncbi:hypothetical protein GH5_03734 [Leishmania sp. Ghana 2012 LV757]|uniref:hypothetical protein n=1 Tax=Leishmania sp. Ghana 2012 LV757 TaxID=2803181 RepID=UPI001B454E3C|nr:hypothetical protein GH5_03734 [Leishmania sp. Ghana 2012 LV757]
MALLDTSCNAIENAAQIVMRVREIELGLRKGSLHGHRHDCPFPRITTELSESGQAGNTVPAQHSLVTVDTADNETLRGIEWRVHLWEPSHGAREAREEPRC